MKREKNPSKFSHSLKKRTRDTKPKKEKNQRVKKSDMIEQILHIFSQSPNEQFNYRHISTQIGAENPVQRAQVAEILSDFAIEGVIQETDRGRYRLAMIGTTAEGTFMRRSNGKNAFLPDGKEEESIFVAERNSMHAMNEDRVKVQLLARRKGAEPEASVVEILKSKNKNFVGRLQVSRGFAFLVTEDKTLANDIFIPPDKLKKGKDGDKAIVRITEWPKLAKNPIGEVVDILGASGENDTEMHAILAEFGLPYKYPEAIEQEADKISDVITPEEVTLREDFREVTTFTVDPKDAKDFDDALSARKLENGHWEIGVHIADVTHYVKEDTPINDEAEQRATSVYLVDRTIPMLPERLSNQICSLRPDEEKCCFSVIFELDADATVIHSKICRTLIKSNRRFNYDEAQEVIETGQGDYNEEIVAVDALAKKLRAQRFANGAINFDRWEVKFEIDESGKPLSVYFKVSKDANKMIEEFMLLANRTVAEFINQKGKPKRTFVYRIHDQPDPEKLETFTQFVQRFGYKLKLNGTKEALAKGFNRLLEEAKGKPEENLVETIAIRTMQKARYTTQNVGHYGLAFDYYTHFTSPIRRYPDMMVHRLLTKYLAGGKSVDAQKYETLCEHSSDMEQLAANAERSSIKYKQVEFMSDKLGEVFEGVISGVTEWGLYVELTDNKCEGLVPMRDLDDDYYMFDDKNYCLTGRSSNRRYQLGDAVTIRVAQANLQRKQLDFQLV